MQLRPYQEECIRAIEARPPGAYLIQMATGLGKTVTFAHIPRRGRMLILSHREELVKQPLKYFDCPAGVEMAQETAPRDAEVVSASVQSLARRLDRFGRDDFDIIVCDEAHHAAAKTYRRSSPFRSPPAAGVYGDANRADSVRLDDVFQDIIFQRDLRWGIQNGYLSDIYCQRPVSATTCAAFIRGAGTTRLGNWKKPWTGQRTRSPRLIGNWARGRR